MINTLVKPEILVNNQGFIDLFLEIESRSKIPFVYVIRKSDNPSELVLKSKVDGSKNPYWKEVSKEVMNCFRVVVDYKERVIRQLSKEGKPETDYEQGELKGKKHISKCLLTDKVTETKTYVMLEFFVESPIKSKTTYFHNGNELDKKFLEKWIKFTETNYDNQGTDKPIRPITLDISNILQVNVDGVIYKRG
jgi:hypothetical protein